MMSSADKYHSDYDVEDAEQRLSFDLTNFGEDGNAPIDTFHISLLDSDTCETVFQIPLPRFFERELAHRLNPDTWCGDPLASFDGLERDLLECVEIVRRAKAAEIAKAEAGYKNLSDAHSKLSDLSSELAFAMQKLGCIDPALADAHRRLINYFNPPEDPGEPSATMLSQRPTAATSPAAPAGRTP